jgi:ArsR family transcriptional regulator
MHELCQFKAEFFKALAHPLRIRILDALRDGEVAVNELSSRLGVEQSTLSQQLAILRNRSIILGRKNGSKVLYSVRDPAVFRLLDVAKEIFSHHLIEFKDLLSKLHTTAAGD